MSKAPGHTQFTRMPRPAYSIAVTRLRFTTPALAALYAPMAKSAKSPEIDAVLTMAPPPR